MATTTQTSPLDARRLATSTRTFGLSLLDEFRGFAMKGNVVDLAVGVIIGAAFGKLVDSLVKNILMPALSLIMPSEQSYVGWKVAVGAKEIPYGLFLGDVVNFIIVAFAVFVFIVKFLGWLARRRAAATPAAAAPAPLTRQEELLAEIRDLLRTQQLTRN
jgi:large conductance mechanosensitive channel